MTSVLAEEQSQRGASIIPDAEFPLTASDFKKLAALIHGEAGIVINEGKANLVYSRLVKRLRAVGLRSFRQYCELVQSSAGAEERVAMIAAMTTNVTRFFREGHHFDHLRTLLEPMVSSARAGKKIRIWSSACSSGEEPYTLSMILRDAIPEPTYSKCRILATDLSTIVLAKAKVAQYDELNVADVPPEIQSKSFVPSPPVDGIRRYEVKPEVRKIVTFGRLNLNQAEAWPMRGPFDLIFCRNVMIYFDDPTRERLVNRFAELLSPGGFLFIGHSESLSSLKTGLRYVKPAVYEKV